MQIKKSILPVTFLFIVFFGTANSQVYDLKWDKSYGGDSRDWNCSISTDASGGIFLIGDSQSDVSGDKNVPLCPSAFSHADIWLMKIDTAGAILWQRDFGADADERSPKLFHLNNPNKEMILACYSTSDISCDKSEANRDTVPLLSADYWICKLDSNGVIIWEKTLGGENFDDYTQITGTIAGEIIICGESNSPIGYDKTVANFSISNDLWALKLDANGNVIWDNVFGGDIAEFMSTIIPADDGSFLLAGSTSSNDSGSVSEPGQGSIDYWMIKVDAAGNKIWDKRFGGSGPDRCNYAAKTPDNGYILCGFTVSPISGDVSEAPKGFQDYWVVKTDSMGVKQWDKRYGGSDGSFGTFVEPSTNGYWVAGYSNSDQVNDVSEPSYGGSDYWVLQIDNVGNLLSDKRFGGDGDEFQTSMAVLSDSVLLVFGSSDSGNSVVKTAANQGWYDNWLVKFSYTDTITALGSELISDDISVFPNPASEFVSIQFNNVLSRDPLNIHFYDIFGRSIFTDIIEYTDVSQDYIINTINFDAGTYLLTLTDNSGLKYSKVVILR